MNISEHSLIYQFQWKALVSEGRCFIPDNLCPYMRRFLRLFIASVAIYTIFSAAALSMLFTPVLLLSPYPLDDWIVVPGIGILLWGIVIVAGIRKLYTTYGAENARYIAAQESTKKAIHKIWNPVGRRLADNIFVRWYKAHHYQICPPINFYDD